MRQGRRSRRGDSRLPTWVIVVCGDERFDDAVVKPGGVLPLRISQPTIECTRPVMYKQQPRAINSIRLARQNELTDVQ